MSEAETPIANVDAVAAWNGIDGDHWTENADRYNRASAVFGERLYAAAQVQPDDHVLDIGCGSGAGTRAFARAAHRGRAHGVDISRRQLELARERAAAEGLANATFEFADAQVHPFGEHAYTLATSQFGVMFFTDRLAAFTNIARAVAPDGRLAMLVWQNISENEWVSEVQGALRVGRDMPMPPPGVGPFGMGERDGVTSLLEKAGFHDVEHDAVRAYVEFGDDADDAFAFMTGGGMVQGMLQDLDADQRALALGNLRAVIESHDTGSGVRFDASAWLIQASR
jgi:SAM-dependent methyltransferase